MICSFSAEFIIFAQYYIYMTPDIFRTNIVGPIKSRRLGISLGVNLLPANGKVCTFNCVYCECGYNEDHRGGQMPDADVVLSQLETKLKEMKANGDGLDVITFAGNGEPTVHPRFAEVIDRTIELRNTYYPNAKVSVLSNATRMSEPSVHAALLKVDNNILKLDSAFDGTVRLIDQPQSSSYSVKDIVEGMKAFEGKLIVQTMFVRGEHEGKAFDNTKPEEVSAWTDLMREIKPKQIMVYSLDRPTPEKALTKVSKEEMTELVKPLIEEGFNISIA